MEFTGELRKMRSNLNSLNSVEYKLLLVDSSIQEEKVISINNHIGENIEISFLGNILCKRCGRKTKNSFSQGFCYPCFKNAPEAAECIIRPELCRAHLGEGRDVNWEKENHNQPHYVYLAVSDVIKVGVTRATQIPTRWIDQGASYAIKLAETPNRYEAGLLEVALKDSFTDKTNWRKMLTNQVDENIDLASVKWELEELLPDDLSDYITDDEDVLELNYPVISYPEKIKSVSLDKTPTLIGKLIGIKGQYLIFEGGSVINLRKHAGYEIILKTE
ncbi:MAG: DUF2797 domain-containing protein [Brumimicrobium sp.]|nr:DUF2797 domain-containing protein [Brumimicrobium sp.]